MIFPITYSAPIGQDRDFVRPADRPAGATVNESRALIALAFGVFGLLTCAMPTSSDAGLFTELPAGSPWSERRTHNFASRAWTWPTVSPADSASAFSCIPGKRTAARATREYARPASPFPGCRKRDRGRHQLACEEMETSPRIHHAGTARSCPRCQLTTPTCANPSRLIQPAVLRTAPLTRQSQGRDPISPALNWGNVWQVQGSNLGRRSRRFYRPLPLATRATCRTPSAPGGIARIAQDAARRLADDAFGVTARGRRV